MVLRANDPPPAPTDAAAAATNAAAGANGDAAAANGGAGVGAEQVALSKEERKALLSQVDPLTKVQIEENRKRVRAKTDYDDLAAPPPKKNAPLNLAKVERYLTGPTPASSSSYLTPEEVAKSRSFLRSSLEMWADSNTSHALPPKEAVTALVDLSPGGALMQTSRGSDLADSCPESVSADLRALYTSICELLKHFWACFPPTTPALQEKATKMYTTLKRFQSVKLQPFQNDLARNYSTISGQLTSHLDQMLYAAFRKFETWQTRKASKR